MEQKITIIGGSGFVGTNLCKFLFDQSIPFEIIDLKLSHRFPKLTKIADVRDFKSLSRAIDGSIVVNLAAVHSDNIKDKNEYFATNVTGAENIVKVCSEKKINKLVFTSSVAVYGFAKPGTGEDGNINPFNEYGRTKYLAEQRYRDWSVEKNNALVIVRPTVIFGKGNRGNVFNLLNYLASGKFIMIGKGDNKKSMAYIGNIVPFLFECIKLEARYKVFNYVDTPDLDMNTLVSIVRGKLGMRHKIRLTLPYFLGMLIGYIADFLSKITGKTLPISAIRVKKFCSVTEFSTDKSSLKGFIQAYTLSDGIMQTLQAEFIDPDPNCEVFFTE
jgi:nucleoside-diphosphate-sugar epimerase